MRGILKPNNMIEIYDGTIYRGRYKRGKLPDQCNKSFDWYLENQAELLIDTSTLPHWMRKKFRDTFIEFDTYSTSTTEAISRLQVAIRQLFDEFEHHSNELNELNELNKSREFEE